jgi:Rrf2 family protein
MFSKACEYGIKAAIYIGAESLKNHRTSLKEIAAEIDSPEAFTAKILQQLSRNSIITSIKGQSGGYEIPRENQESIRLINIVMAIDGESVFTNCALGLKKCSNDSPCPVHHKFIKIRQALKTMLETTTLLELTKKRKSGQATYLKLKP